MHFHGQEILKNYLIPRAMLSSRVDGDSHKWIDAGNRGKTDELIRKKKSIRSHSAPPFYQGKKKKFFAMTEFSRKAAGNKNFKSVHDVPLMPAPAVRRLHHSVAAICLASRQSSHQCDQSSMPSCGDNVFSDERSSVKLKLVDIWNSKLQALRECTSTHTMGSQNKVHFSCHLFLHDGESK